MSLLKITCLRIAGWNNYLEVYETCSSLKGFAEPAGIDAVNFLFSLNSIAYIFLQNGISLLYMIYIWRIWLNNWAYILYIQIWVQPLEPHDVLSITEVTLRIGHSFWSTIDAGPKQTNAKPRPKPKKNRHTKPSWVSNFLHWNYWHFYIVNTITKLKCKVASFSWPQN